MSARKPDAVLFQFNNGTTAVETDIAFVANIRRHLEEDESETPLFARTPDDVATLRAAALDVETPYNRAGLTQSQRTELAAKLRAMTGVAPS